VKTLTGSDVNILKCIDSPVTETLKILVMLNLLLLICSLYSPECVFVVCVMVRDPV